MPTWLPLSSTTTIRLTAMVWARSWKSSRSPSSRSEARSVFFERAIGSLQGTAHRRLSDTEAVTGGPEIHMLGNCGVGMRVDLRLQSGQVCVANPRLLAPLRCGLKRSTDLVALEIALNRP